MKQNEEKEGKKRRKRKEGEQTDNENINSFLYTIACMHAKAMRECDIMRDAECEKCENVSSEMRYAECARDGMDRQVSKL